MLNPDTASSVVRIVVTVDIQYIYSMKYYGLSHSVRLDNSMHARYSTDIPPLVALRDVILMLTRSTEVLRSI
jgi:hypothetical protein